MSILCDGNQGRFGSRNLTWLESGSKRSRLQPPVPYSDGQKVHRLETIFLLLVGPCQWHTHWLPHGEGVSAETGDQNEGQGPDSGGLGFLKGAGGGEEAASAPSERFLAGW